ncbi:hypothetical protein R1sor_014649 [Riccia sorocarpa]|uniref:Helicase ATP-binding domain-containing protein n=1 Tax=Riccia sorocarpa TaxID=122646 RepID=A0ABD3HDT6_9MARC
MAKGDDAIAKHRNKVLRKRKRRAGADTLEAIQGVQAAKRRRKAGTRRVCEGMCYALPTPDDPFLEKRYHKLQQEKKKEVARKAASLEPVTFVENLTIKGKKYQGGEDAGESDDDVTAGYQKQLKRKRGKDVLGDGDQASAQQHQNKQNKAELNHVKQRPTENGHNAHAESNGKDNGTLLAADSARGTPTSNGHPGKSGESEADVTDESVLAVISEAGVLEADFGRGDGLNADSTSGNLLAKEFWKAHKRGVDVLACCQVSVESRVLGIVAPAAAAVKGQKSKEDAGPRPLVLILVVSQDEALRARRVFRPLKKALGITSVCLHEGTSVERQIDGLRLQTPDIIVATPGRLCELLSAQAVTLSSVLLFAVDQLAVMIDRGLQSHVSKIKEHVNRAVRSVVFSDDYPEKAVIIARQLLADPIERVTSQKNVKESSACITQTVTVFTDVNKRMSKVVKIAQQFLRKQKKKDWAVLVVVEKEEIGNAVLSELVKIGYKAAALASTQGQRSETAAKQIRDGTLQALVCTREEIDQIPLDKMQLVINFCFPASMEVYEQILTGMARQSVEGVLHTFCTASMASSASQLVQLLQSCHQDVPQALQMLADAASLVQRGLVK